LNHIQARHIYIAPPWGHFNNVIFMFNSVQIASAAGPSSVRDGAKRNDFNKINSSQIVRKHDTATALPSPPKRTRKPIAELPPKPMVVPEPAATPAFDVRSIVPQKKAVKTIAQLREATLSSKKKNLSVDGPFLCIDGEIRKFQCAPLHHRQTVSEHPLLSGSNGEAVETKQPREQFTAYGIEVSPTTMTYPTG
jgi:hypothetical protein